MGRRTHFAVLAAVLACSRAAHAADEDEKSSDSASKKSDESSQDDAKKSDESTGHGFQFGFRAGVALGYKMDFRYDRSPFCRAFDPSKSEQQKVCGFGAPPGIELALSFAPLDGVEPYVFGRFGFSGESDTDTKALQLYGVGVRLYTMSDSRLKIYIEPALALEVEGGAGHPQYAANNPEYKTDVVFHAAVGPQYDFNRYVGAFLNAGLDVGVLRSISATLVAIIGVQARFP
jgi:hypothetical protein